MIERAYSFKVAHRNDLGKGNNRPKKLIRDSPLYHI